MISKRLALNQIITSLKRKGFKHNGGTNFCGKLRVSKLDIDIDIDVRDPLFGVYPVVRVRDISQLEGKLLSHIEGQENNICYKPSTGINLDLSRPAASVLRVIDECKNALELIINGDSISEISKEYHFYWKPNLDYRLLYSDLSLNTFVPAKLFFVRHTDETEFIAIDKQAKLAGYKIRLQSDIMLFKINSDLYPVGDIIQPKNLHQLETWILGQKVLNQSILDKIYVYLSQSMAVMLIANNASLGFELTNRNIYKGNGFRTKGRLALLKTRKKEVNINGIRAIKCDLASVVGRNITGFTTLEGKDIALIGCGTIGGHLSKMLVQSGAGLNGKLTIVDKEIFSVGNIGRHLLGIEHVGKYKATEVKKEIDRFHPQANISALVCNALEIWETLRTYDLIIDATGDWNFQNALNYLFMSETEGKVGAVIHSWILLNGEAVQSFLNAKDNYACFRCLKPDFQQLPRFRAVKDYNKIMTVPASCGDGDYIPFPVDVSTMAASLTNRAAIDWASGDPGYRLRTIITDFKSNNTEHLRPNNPSKSAQCPICGKTK